MKLALTVCVVLAAWTAFSEADKKSLRGETVTKKSAKTESGKFHKGDCKLSCVLEWNPLCANDSAFFQPNKSLVTTRTFENPCIYTFQNCLENGKWHMLHQGECAPPSTHKVAEPTAKKAHKP